MPAVSKKNKDLVAPKASKKHKSGGVTQTVISGQLQKQINNKKAKRKRKPKKGVVFVKNLPHGFFEEQLKNYFAQFGKVTRLRLARSTRTGNSKGYAYVEFAVPDVAKIAAETMDNYLMFQKIVKAAYIPPEQQKYDYFRTQVRKVLNKVGKEIFVSPRIQHKAKEMKKYNNWNAEALAKRNHTTLNKLSKLKKKYAHLDIDFDKLMVGSKPAENSNDSETLKSDSGAESTNTNTVDNEESDSGTSDSSSDDSDEPKCGSLLLIKKPKKVPTMKSTNLKDEKTPNKHSKKTNKSTKLNAATSQYKKLKQNNEEKENLDESLNKSSSEEDELSDASSLNGNENNFSRMKNQKNIGKHRERIMKRKVSAGGIQKAKNKQTKSKSEKNKFSEKSMKNLMEATFKEIMAGGNKGARIITRSAAKKGRK